MDDGNGMDSDGDGGKDMGQPFNVASLISDMEKRIKIRCEREANHHQERGESGMEVEERGRDIEDVGDGVELGKLAAEGYRKAPVYTNSKIGDIADDVR